MKWFERKEQGIDDIEFNFGYCRINYEELRDVVYNELIWRQREVITGNLSTEENNENNLDSQLQKTKERLQVLNEKRRQNVRKISCFLPSILIVGDVAEMGYENRYANQLRH